MLLERDETARELSNWKRFQKSYDEVHKKAKFNMFDWCAGRAHSLDTR